MPFKRNDERILPTKQEVLEKSFSEWQLISTEEEIRVEKAIHRMLAEDVYSLTTIPYKRSAMLDGIAVDSAYFPQDLKENLKGHYERADMGQDFPDTYNAVIAIEQVTVEENGDAYLKEEVDVTPGMGINPQGKTVTEGDLILTKGRLLGPLELAILQMGGIQKIKVVKKPVVAFIPTGNELIAPGTEMGRGKTIDINSIMVKHLIEEMGGEPLMYPITKDSKDVIYPLLEDALSKADIIIINGGSSKGEKDFSSKFIEERGTFICHWVAAAPGKPLGVSIVDNTPVINLPGPPLAAFHGMEWCIRLMIGRYFRQSSSGRLKILAELTKDLFSVDRTEFLTMMKIQKNGNSYYGTPVFFKDVKLAETLSCDGFLYTPMEAGKYKKGDLVEVELLVDKNHLQEV